MLPRFGGWRRMRRERMMLYKMLVLSVYYERHSQGGAIVLIVLHTLGNS